MKFYNSIEAMKSKPPLIENPFILQWEIPNPISEATRKYCVFNGVKEYLTYLNVGRYNTCHEVFISSTFNPSEEVIGHPAFDIDIHADTIPPNWQTLLEEDITYLLNAQYPILNLKKDDIIWVWMSSNSIGKTSKHLVLKNIIFTTWRSQMKLLIENIKELPLEHKNSSNIILDSLDLGITRKSGSLRLPLNAKVSNINAIITFDDPSHKFIDGLVMIYNESNISGSHMITISDLSPLYMPKCKYIIPSYIEDADPEPIINSNDIISTFNRLNKDNQLGLIPSTIDEKVVALKRNKSASCYISGKVHDNDNAYIFKKGEDIYFACHRGCTIDIAGITYKYLRIDLPTADNPKWDIIKLIIKDIKNL